MVPAAGKGERQLYSQARITVLLMQPYLKIPSNSYKLRDLERVICILVPRQDMDGFQLAFDRPTSVFRSDVP